MLFTLRREFLVKVALGDEPLHVSKEEEECHLSRQEANSPGLWDKELFGDELPVNRPSVREDSAELERAVNVLEGVREEELGAEGELDDAADEEPGDGPPEAEPLEEEAEEAWGVEQDVHLNADSEAKYSAADGPEIEREEDNGYVEEGHGPAVVKESEDKDGVYSVGRREQEKSPGRDYLGPLGDDKYAKELH